MRLIRFGPVNNEKPGILDSNGSRRDMSAHFHDWNTKFFASGDVDRLAEILRRDATSLPVVPETERWAAPVARPCKVICIGLNYSDHAEESGMPIPAEPIVFLNASNTVIGPYDHVQIPRGSEKLTGKWSLELSSGKKPAI